MGVRVDGPAQSTLGVEGWVIQGEPHLGAAGASEGHTGAPSARVHRVSTSRLDAEPFPVGRKLGQKDCD